MPASIIESPFTRSKKVAAQILGNCELVFDVLLGQQRPAGCDLPEQRQLRQRDERFAGTLTPHELERTRLRRVASQQARPLEVREMCVHGRG